MCICKREDPSQKCKKKVPKKKITSTTSQKTTKNAMWRQLQVLGRFRGSWSTSKQGQGWAWIHFLYHENDSNRTNKACTLLHSNTWHQKKKRRGDMITSACWCGGLACPGCWEVKPDCWWEAAVWWFRHLAVALRAPERWGCWCGGSAISIPTSMLPYSNGKFKVCMCKK